MRTSNIIVRLALVGLFAFTAIALSSKSVASGNGNAGGPAGNIGPDSGEGGRSEDGIGTGPILADYTSAPGYQVGLPSNQVGALLATISGTGYVTIHHNGNDTSVVSFTGDMSFRLRLNQISSPGFQVTSPKGNTVGRLVSQGPRLIFVQRSR